MKRVLTWCLMAAALPAMAIEYRSVNAAAVLYDVQSQRGSKLFVIREGTPVELVVSLEGWGKVRDAEGGMAWIEKKFLSEKRTLIVTAARAEIRPKADETSPPLFAAEKDVLLDYLETVPGGWVRVRHRDGQGGFVRANQVWGF